MKTILLSLVVFSLAAGTATAQTLDGQNIPSEGLPLLATQDTPTQFGDATGGGQDSVGGSELNQMFGRTSGSTLNLLITGNLEGNFNKLWIFFDAEAGGENTLAGDNVDGGFDEIQDMAGLSFDSGFDADHGLRLEIGSGFWGINAFDLVDNTAGSVASGGGPGDLPLGPQSGAFGVDFGWDNSNILGVDGASAAGASSATTGWEFAIDMPTLFGSTPTSVGVSAFISSSDGTFLSNQFLPGVGGGGNLGDPSSASGIGFATAIPEPSSALFLGLGLAALALRRRR